MPSKFNKDLWIIDALKKSYLIPNKDGSIMRCKNADKDGNLLTNEYRLVTQQIHKKSGRVYFNATWRGFTKSLLVNRVIALRYLPNPLNLPVVNHIDGNKENNALTNLEWSTGSDNERHAHRTGLKTGRGSSNSNAKLTSAQVLAIRQSQENVSSIADTFGVAKSTIINILSRKTWKHI
jgi:HNH endonuclease